MGQMFMTLSESCLSLKASDNKFSYRETILSNARRQPLICSFCTFANFFLKVADLGSHRPVRGVCLRRLDARHINKTERR